MRGEFAFGRRSLNAAGWGRRLVIILALIGANLQAAPEAKAEPGLERAWQKAAKLLTNEASAEFEQIRKQGGPEKREATFGAALMLLNTQPKTEWNIQTASDYFGELATGDDDLALWSAYYQGRVEQIHRQTPDLKKARELYSGLIASDPDHPAAQAALVKLSMLEIYDESPLEDKRAKIEALEQRAPSLSSMPARRDLYLLLAHARTRLFQEDAAALQDLMAADQIGILRSKPRAGLWVQIGELARETGQTDIAKRYYDQFLTKYPRDNRHFIIQLRRDELETNAPSATQTP